MTGQLPSSPKYRTSRLISDYATAVLKTHSNKRYSRMFGAHRWKIRVSYPPLSQTQAMELYSFLMLQSGVLSEFTVIPQETKTPLGNPLGSPLVKAAEVQLFSNNDFASGTSPWVGSNATLSNVSGKLRITVNSNGNAYAYIPFSSANGLIYDYSIDYVTDASSSVIDLKIGQSINSTHYVNAQAITTGTIASTLRATKNGTSYFTVYINSGVAGEYIEIDNVSMIQSEQLVLDRNILIYDVFYKKWNVTFNWTLASLYAEHTAGKAGYMYQTNITTFPARLLPGREYKIQYTLANVTNGNIYPYVLGNLGKAENSNGSKTGFVVAGYDSDWIGFYADEDFSGRISAISVSESGPVNTANSDRLKIDGATPNIFGWLKRGDFFSISGHPKVYCITESINVDNNGAATLFFKPRLQITPGDNSVVNVTNVAFNMALDGDVLGYLAQSPFTHGIEIDLVESIIS